MSRTGTQPTTARRWAAALAAMAGAAVLAGAVTMLVALVAAPGSWLAGYVSEAGTALQPYAIAYRCGLILLAAGVAFLSLAHLVEPAEPRDTPPRAPSLPGRHGTAHHRRRLVAALLGLAAVLAGTSGAVSCSLQCPLPPFEPTTVSDVVHTAASIVGMVLLAAAMLATALSGRDRLQRSLAAAAVTLTVPLGGASGLTMLFVGRGTLGATLERLLLVVAVSWLIGTSGLTLIRNSTVELWSRSRTASRRWRNSSPP